MRVVDALRRAQPRRADPLVALAELLRDAPERGHAGLARWASTLVPGSPDERLAALERMRPALLATIPATLKSLRNRPIPLATEEAVRFDRLARALGSARDACRRVHAEFGAAAAADGADPRNRPSPRSLLAIGRALDLQSRLMVVGARLRVAPARDDWDLLCRLAEPLVRAGAFDEPFAEPPSTDPAVPRPRPGTARAAFALPLLMRLIEPLGVNGAELDLAHALARRAARTAGLRLAAEGRPPAGDDGPALVLSSRHAVRLDTRATVATLDRCIERIEAGTPPGVVGLRTPITSRPLVALLRRLREVWGPGYQPAPLSRPARTHALLYLGLPRPQAPAGSFDVLDRGGDMLARVSSGPTGSIYVYGRDVPEAEPSAQSKARAEQRDASLRAMLLSHGDQVAWRGTDARRAVFSRTATEPRLRLGQLVAALPGRAADRSGRRGGDAASPLPLRVGRVATLAHTGRPASRQPSGHDLGIVFWPGAVRPVRVRVGDADAFEDAWWYPGDDGEAAALVLMRDRFVAPVDVLVRDVDVDRRLRLTALIERGLDYDRVALAG